MCAYRTDSQSSVASIGIGQGPVRPDIDDGIPKLYPEGGAPYGQNTYDCVVYLIYCSVHDRIAVTNIERSKVVWFPFVAMAEGVTWEQASLDGISMLIGKRDAELDTKLQAGKLPKFQMSNLHVLRVQLPNERFFIRLAQFVNIEKTEGYRCCERTPRLNWIQASDILNDRIENLWGPEVKLFTAMLINPEQKFIYEYSLDNALAFLTNPERINSFQGKLLQSSKILPEYIMAIYEDFVEHCFPAFYMSLDSFKAFMIRYGFARTDQRFPWLFNAIGYSRKGYIDFNEFLIGLVCMEPTTEHCEARLRLIFRYYDVDNTQVMSIKEFVALMQDLNPNANAEQLRNLVDQGIKIILVDKKMNYETFHKAVFNNLLKGTQNLCRSPRPIIGQIRQTVKTRNEQRVNLNQGDKAYNQKEISKKERGICNGCRSQRYNYGLHCVYFDTNGRCVKPLRLKDVKFSPDDPVMTPIRYSAEFVFGIGSICNMFIDVIRDVYRKNDTNGLMANPEEAPCFARYLRTLCENVSDLVIAEERLMKINAPAIVIGDITGNIDSLFAMEKLLWQSVPILSSNLVFLGNYTGVSRYGVEVISYMFALKMLAPNKVFLLRGFNETREANSRELLIECNQKYGLDIGKYIWDSINEVFDKLPFCVVIDESIICVHSGIPKAVSRLQKFTEIPEEIANVEKESPLAFEIIFNIPKESDNSYSEKNEYRKTPIFNGPIFANFMRQNNLTHMIRGHDNPRDGYRLNFGGRCLTLSSSWDNSSIVAFVDGTNAIVRLVKLSINVRYNKATMSQI